VVFYVVNLAPRQRRPRKVREQPSAPDGEARTEPAGTAAGAEPGRGEPAAEEDGDAGAVRDEGRSVESTHAVVHPRSSALSGAPPGSSVTSSSGEGGSRGSAKAARASTDQREQRPSARATLAALRAGGSVLAGPIEEEAQPPLRVPSASKASRASTSTSFRLPGRGASSQQHGGGAALGSRSSSGAVRVLEESASVRASERPSRASAAASAEWVRVSSREAAAIAEEPSLKSAGSRVSGNVSRNSRKDSQVSSFQSIRSSHLGGFELGSAAASSLPSEDPAPEGAAGAADADAVGGFTAWLLGGASEPKALERETNAAAGLLPDWALGPWGGAEQTLPDGDNDDAGVLLTR